MQAVKRCQSSLLAIEALQSVQEASGNRESMGRGDGAGEPRRFINEENRKLLRHPLIRSVHDSIMQ